MAEAQANVKISQDKRDEINVIIEKLEALKISLGQLITNATNDVEKKNANLDAKPKRQEELKSNIGTSESTMDL